MLESAGFTYLQQLNILLTNVAFLGSGLDMITRFCIFENLFFVFRFSFFVFIKTW